LAFDDEEVDDERGDEVAGGEDVAVAEVDGFGDEGREEGDEEVPEPVGGLVRREGLDMQHRGGGGREGWLEREGRGGEKRTYSSESHALRAVS
jgi:hypothetical protein